MEDFKILLEYQYKGKVEGDPFYEVKVSADRDMNREDILDWLDWAFERIEEMNILKRIK